MVFVSQKSLRVAGSSQIVAVVALHMHRPVAEIPILDKSPHAPRCVPELIIVSCGYLKTFFYGQCNQCLSLVDAKREWLLHIDVAPRLETLFGNGEMAFRRSADVDNVRQGLAEHHGQVAKMCFEGEPLGELP